jgi:L-iditol 2-dehydrogenase
MRVAMYYSNEDVRLEDMPKPKIGVGELLVKVMACGICGSDVMEWYRINRAPLVLGHEVTGEVAEVGEGVTRFKEGDRVFATHHVPCNTCRYCLSDRHTACKTLHNTNLDPGGFAEYIRVPAINVDRGTFLLPEEISFEEGTFIEPLACVLRGQRRANVKLGQTVLILGSGISGLLHLQLARALGATRVITTDINEYRLKAARRFRADEAIHAEKEDVPTRLRQLNEGAQADRVIVSTAAKPAITQALQCVDQGGTILFFAPTKPGINITIPFNVFWSNQMTLTSSYAATPADIIRAVELIRAGRIRVHEMITHRLSLAETGLGFKLVAEANESIKVIIMPHGHVISGY